MSFVCPLTIAVSLAGILMAADSPGGFEKVVQPVLAKTCAPCHNERLISCEPVHSSADRVGMAPL